MAVRMAGEEAGAHAPLAPPGLCCARLSRCGLGPRCADAAGTAWGSAVLPGRAGLGRGAGREDTVLAELRAVLSCPVLSRLIEAGVAIKGRV